MLSTLLEDPRYDVESLFTIVDTTSAKVPMHDVSSRLLTHQVEALRLPHRIVQLGRNGALEGIKKLIEEAVSEDVECFAFGDLFLEGLRADRERNMHGLGIRPLFPLWLRPTKSLITELIQSGTEAVITSVDLAKLPASFLGRHLSLELVDELI